MEENGIRINKFLSEAGVCSRREADRQVELGNITIDGKVAETGARVLPGQTVLFQGKKVSKEEEMILIAFHKPVGIVCTAEKREKNNVIDYINYPKRIYPVGRLDKDSEGLLLLTNNGDIVNKMMRSGNMHEKEYIVTVNRPVTESFIHGLANGVPLAELNTMTRKCHVKHLCIARPGVLFLFGIVGLQSRSFGGCLSPGWGECHFRPVEQIFYYPEYAGSFFAILE